MGRRKKENNIVQLHQTHETDEEIALRIEERFLILELMVQASINGTARSLIVSGPPGLGKSYSIKRRLSDYDESKTRWNMFSGFSRATGLFKQLYKYRDKGSVLVLDDIDGIFYDDVSLALLKKVCDTTEERNVSWLSEGKLFDDDTGELIPKTFNFQGSVIFITNLDFDGLINNGDKRAVHLQALLSRSHYLDLTMKEPKEYLIRIRQVVNEEDMLDEYTDEVKECTMEYLEENYLDMRELSLRVVIKIAQNYKEFGDLGESVCNATVLNVQK